MEKLLQIIIQLRAMQLFYHHCHLTVSKALFFQDHLALGDFYEALEDDYDRVSERLIGLYGSDGFLLPVISKQVDAKLAAVVPYKENVQCFEQGLKMEQELVAMCTAVGKSLTFGTEQLLGDVCDKSEGRQYKIKQRIKK